MKNSICLNRFLLVVVFLFSSSKVFSATIDFSALGFGKVTYFEGKVQESVLDYFGLSGSFDLDFGESVTLFAHGVWFDAGSNDGTGNLGGPDETHVFETEFTINGVTQTLVQQGRYRQILHNQFQFDLLESEKLTFNIASLGMLTVSTAPKSSQGLANLSNQGSLFFTTFELTELSQVPLPASIWMFSFAFVVFNFIRRRVGGRN